MANNLELVESEIRSLAESEDWTAETTLRVVIRAVARAMPPKHLDDFFAAMEAGVATAMDDDDDPPHVFIGGDGRFWHAGDSEWLKGPAWATRYHAADMARGDPPRAGGGLYVRLDECRSHGVDDDGPDVEDE